MTAPKRSECSVYYVARLVLQTATPLSIGTGETDGMFDNLLVRDANDLPAIPGSSLAGVLRHLYWRVYEADQEKEQDALETLRLFGQAKQRKPEGTEVNANDTIRKAESPSLLHVSWGCLHTREDVPVEGLQPDIADWKDEVIQDALQPIPIKRDHVKLNHRGASDAASQGKFDRVSLTKGHRFSVELSLWGTLEDKAPWNRVLGLLTRPDFRLGGGTRRGMGKLELVRCYQGYFKLGETDAQHHASELARFSRLGPSLADIAELSAVTLAASHSLESLNINLEPEVEGYRFGGGIEPLHTSADEQNEPDLMPVTERMVTWDKTGSIVEKQIVIPASSIKGALSHRTAYHYNRLSGRHADKQPGETADAYRKRIQGYLDNNLAVRILFGYVIAKSKERDEEIAHIGCVILDDLHLDKDYQRRMQLAHNGIDRFTGGVRESVLFSEEVVTHRQAWPVVTFTLTRSRTGGCQGRCRIY